MIKITPTKAKGIIAETLSRMGCRSTKKKSFYPSCHLVDEDFCEKNIESLTDEVKKELNYSGVSNYIAHFKELFLIEGLESTFNNIDKLRLNTISYLLEMWKMVKLDTKVEEILHEPIDVLKKSEKLEFGEVNPEKYRVIPKYKAKRHIETE